MKNLLRAALATLLLVLAVGCSDDDSASGPSASGVDEKVQVGLGDEFTWNDFTVAKGWTLDSTTAVIEMEESEQPQITAEVTNDGDEARFAIFEIVFVGDGQLQATLICRSDEELEPGASGELQCPGLGQVMPRGYDLIQVQKFTR